MSARKKYLLQFAFAVQWLDVRYKLDVRSRVVLKRRKMGVSIYQTVKETNDITKQSQKRVRNLTVVRHIYIKG